jgi:hypothetical protein
MGIHPFVLLTFCTLLSKYVLNIFETNKTSTYEKSKYVFLCEISLAQLEASLWWSQV